ncbi:DUF3037 domain-containing protein, partial [Planctomycetota bacterium]
KSYTGYYSIIQYCADLSRFESANIGVLLFCPELQFADAQTSSGNDRIRKFFGKSHDWRKIDSLKLGIEERLRSSDSLKTVEDLNEFIDRRANQFRLTEPKPIRVRDPKRQLDELFSDLVGGTPRGKQGPSVKKELAAALEQPALTSKLHKSVEVTVPVDGRKLEVPYAFQNGRFNLIQPVRFRGENPVQTAYRYAVEGNSIYETHDDRFGEMKLLVVGSFGSGKSEKMSAVQKVLDNHHVGLYSIDDLGGLVHEIQTTGKDKSEP